MTETISVLTYFDENYKMCQLKKPVAIEITFDKFRSDNWYTLYAPALSNVGAGANTITSAINDILWTARHLFDEFVNEEPEALHYTAKQTLAKLSEYFREESK